MKAYIGIKFHQDYRNKDLVDSISLALENQEYQTICVVRDNEKGGQVQLSAEELMRVTFEKIDECSLMVIDITEKGVGLGIEAGYAYSKNIPIITIAKRGSDIPKTLSGISKSVLFYDNEDEIKNTNLI